MSTDTSAATVDAMDTPPPPPIAGGPLAVLTAQETSARSSLAQVALDREATFARALAFMHACHAALYAAIDALRALHTEKDASEERLIGAEMESSACGDLVTRTEETRRFLVNRVRCAAWEKKSHFHLTALDHMLGNCQPALFDVASMLRGHLAICAMARSAMVAQTNLQAHITRQVDAKEASFARVKTLGEEIDATQARTEEFKAILRDMKRTIGHDLERFLERKKRMKRQTSSSSASATSEVDTPKMSPTSPPTFHRLPSIPSSSAGGSMDFRSSLQSPSAASDAFGTLRLQPLDTSACEEDVPPTPTMATAGLLSPNTIFNSLSPTVSLSPFRPSAGPADWTPIGHSESATGPPRTPSPRPKGMNGISPKSLSPPSPTALSWPMPSAPPNGQSLLVSSLAAGDVWPDELEALASSHVEQVTHVSNVGVSSHALHAEEATLQIEPSDPFHPTPPLTPSPASRPSSLSLPAFASAVSSAPPGSHPATAIVTSPPRGQLVPSSFLRASADGSAQQRSSSTPIAISSRNAKTSKDQPTTAATPVVAAAAADAAGGGSGSSRQGYLSIKMRYFQSLGQVKAVNTPPSSPRPVVTSAALALALPTASGSGGSTRWGARQSSTGDSTSPIGSSASSSAAVSPATTAAASSSSSAASSSPSSSPPAIRPRAMFSRSFSEGANKRWMLRPLPPNATAAMSKQRDEQLQAAMLDELPELTPLHDANIHAPPVSSPPSPAPATTTPSSPSTTSSSHTHGVASLPATSPPAAAAPVVKKSWWSSLFSRKSKQQPAPEEAPTPLLTPASKKAQEKEHERRAKEADKLRKKQEKEAKLAAKKGLGFGSGGGGGGGGGATGSLSVPISTRSVSSPSSMSPLPASGSLPPIPSMPVATRRLAEWQALQQLYDEIAEHAARQQAAWETLESVLDRRERVAADERKLAVEQEKKRIEQERTAAAAALLAAAAAAAAASRKTITMVESPVAPMGHHIAKGASGGGPLVPSSHALSSSSSSVLLLASASSSSSSSSSSSTASGQPAASTVHSSGGGSSSSASATSMLGGSSGSASLVGATVANALERDRTRTKSTVHSLLQSVPGPTLMSEFETLDISGQSPPNLLSSAIIIPPDQLRPLAMAVLAQLQRGGLRSLPSTPPPSLPTAMGGHNHIRRHSDSSHAPNAPSPKSAPATMRSSSFSYAASSGGPEFDAYRADMQRYLHHRNSPPSPSSLVC